MSRLFTKFTVDFTFQYLRVHKIATNYSIFALILIFIFWLLHPFGSPQADEGCVDQVGQWRTQGEAASLRTYMYFLWTKILCNTILQN